MVDLSDLGAKRLNGFFDLGATQIAPPRGEPQSVEEFEQGQPITARSELSRGVARSATRGVGAVLDAARIFSDSPRLKKIADEFASISEQIPTKAASIDDVMNDPSLAPAYVGRVVGELAPQAVAAYLTGGVASGLASVAGAGRAAQRLSAGAGAATTSVPQEVGGIFRETEELTGKGDAAAALTFGVPAGLLDAVAAERMVSQVFGKATREGQRLAWRGQVRAALKEVPKQLGVESATEAAQEGLALLADKSADETFELLTPENGLRLLESAVAGAIGGGIIGGVGLATLPAQKNARNREAERLRGLRSRYDGPTPPIISTDETSGTSLGQVEPITPQPREEVQSNAQMQEEGQVLLSAETQAPEQRVSGRGAAVATTSEPEIAKAAEPVKSLPNATPEARIDRPASGDVAGAAQVGVAQVPPAEVAEPISPVPAAVPQSVRAESRGGAGETLPERVRIGKSPQPYTVLERLTASAIERENGEQPVRVRNEKTGEESIVLESQIRPIKVKGATRTDLASGKVEGAATSIEGNEKAKMPVVLESGASKVEAPFDENTAQNQKGLAGRVSKAARQTNGQASGVEAGTIRPEQHLGVERPVAASGQPASTRDLRIEGEQGAREGGTRESISSSENNQTAILTDEEARQTIEDWKIENPNVPVELVNDESMVRNGRGVQGLFSDGKITVNTAFIKDSDELFRVLNEERAHSVLSTAAGQKAVREIVLREGKSEVDQLRRQYTQRDGESDADYEARLVEEFVAKSSVENTTVWQRIVAAVRRLLSRFGLVTLSDREVASALVRSLSKEVSARELAGEPVATERESLTDKPLSDVLQGRVEDEDTDAYVSTEVYGVKDNVLGREQFTPEQRERTRDIAKAVFDEAGVAVTLPEPDGHWQVVPTGKEQNAAGRRLVTLLKRELQKYGAGAIEMTSLVNSIVLDFKNGRMDEMFSPAIRRELYQFAQGDRSHRGVALAALRGAGQAITFVSQNIDAVLHRTWHSDYGGTHIDAVLGKIRSNLRAFFTPQVIAEIVKANPAFGKVPDAAKIIGDGLDSEFANLTELRDTYLDALIKAGVDPKEAVTVARQIVEALKPRIRLNAAAAATGVEAGLTPDEKVVFKGEKTVWKKLLEMVVRGEFDNGPLLREKAAKNGWKPPSDDEIARIKRLAERVLELQSLSKREIEDAKGDPARLARERAVREEATLPRRLPLMREMEAAWGSITRPIDLRPWRFFGQHRANNAAFLNELISANLLFRTSFAFKQAASVVSQFFMHIPTRAIGQAIERHAQSKRLDQDTALARDVYDSLTGSFGSALAGFKDGMVQFVAALRGRGEARNVDRLMSGISAIERIDARAKYHAERGEMGKAKGFRMLGWIRLGYRIAQAFDNLHGIPSEYLQMRHQVVLEMMRNGRSRAEAQTQADNVIQSIKASHIEAVSQAKAFLDENGMEYTAETLREISYRIARRWAYETIRSMGLPADDFAQANRQLRETIGWNEREAAFDKGIGGVTGGSVAGISKGFEKIGIPLAMSRFGNAIAIGINRAMHFTPIGFFPQAFGGENNAWFKTELDRNQRKVEASIGTAIGSIAFLLALSGVFVVRLRWPRDKEERDLWEAEGRKPNTVEIANGDGTFTAISLNTGPMQFVAPYLAAGGALRDKLVERENAQEKLNAKAARKGLSPEKIRPMSVADLAGVAAQAGYQTVLGGRTAAGAMSSLSDFGTLNVTKLAASQVAPLIPTLPAWQEVSRMSGVVLDSKLATFTDFLLPLPSSPARRVNMLGDPSGTPDDVQRIVQVLTGGTFVGVDPTEARARRSYEVLFASGYRPPSIDPNKGFAIGNTFRPFNDAELEQYSIWRGREFKDAIGSLPSNADIKTVRAAFRSSNARALQRMGVSVKMPKGTTTRRRRRSGLRRTSSRLRGFNASRRRLRSLRYRPALYSAAA